jgi:hypothetical protein
VLDSIKKNSNINIGDGLSEDEMFQGMKDLSKDHLSLTKFFFCQSNSRRTFTAILLSSIFRVNVYLIRPRSIIFTLPISINSANTFT